MAAADSDGSDINQKIQSETPENTGIVYSDESGEVELTTIPKKVCYSYDNT